MKTSFSLELYCYYQVSLRYRTVLHIKKVNESIEYIRSSLGLHKESYNEALDRAR